MSQVLYGDTFYLYGYTLNQTTGVATNYGWITLQSTSGDNDYFVFCQQGCNSNSSLVGKGPYPLTVIPANPRINPGTNGDFTSGANIGKNSTVATPSSSQNPFIQPPNSNSSLNLYQTPVLALSATISATGSHNVFYIGSSQSIQNNNWSGNNWAGSKYWMSVTGSQGDVQIDNISSYPEQAQISPYNVTNAGPNNTFIYGQTAFNIGLPYNNPDGNNCTYPGTTTTINRKQAIWGLDTSSSQVGGQYKIGPIYNNSCTGSSVFQPIYFMFVPTNPYLCQNNQCQTYSYNISNPEYSYKIGPYYSSSGACSSNCIKSMGPSPLAPTPVGNPPTSIAPAGNPPTGTAPISVAPIKNPPTVPMSNPPTVPMSNPPISPLVNPPGPVPVYPPLNPPTKTTSSSKWWLWLILALFILAILIILLALIFHARNSKAAVPA